MGGRKGGAMLRGINMVIAVGTPLSASAVWAAICSGVNTTVMHAEQHLSESIDGLPSLSSWQGIFTSDDESEPIPSQQSANAA